MCDKKERGPFEIRGPDELLKLVRKMVAFKACVHEGGRYCIVNYYELKNKKYIYLVCCSGSSEKEAWETYMQQDDANKTKCRLKGAIFESSSSTWVMTAPQIEVEHVSYLFSKCSCFVSASVQEMHMRSDPQACDQKEAQQKEGKYARGPLSVNKQN